MPTSYTVAPAGPQQQFQNDQTLDVDIDKIYTNYIVEIDKIRSHVSVQDNPSISNITSGTLSQIPTNVIMSNDPQESRCHAFFRLLGLPVTDGTSLYTPGFDLPNNNDKVYQSKLKIAQSLFQISGIKNILDARENNVREFSSIFSLQDINASVLAMSLAEVRPLTASLNAPTILDTTLSDYSYTIDLAGRLATSVQDSSGDYAHLVKSTRYHILSPLIVDPRIDFNVYPKRNMVAVPFLLDKTQTTLSPGIFLKRPYIEKVCRDVFSQQPVSASLGTQTKQIITNIQKSNFIIDDSLIQAAFNPNAITSSTVQFTNFYNSIRSVLVKLKEAVDKVTPVLAGDPNNLGVANYNWIPIPNVNGPEYGSTTTDLLSQQANDPNNTSLDKKIITQLYSQALTSISNKLTTNQDPDVGGFAFDNTEPTPDVNSSDSFPNVNQPSINLLVNDRKNQTDAANDAIKTIEIIMGEFSGLGLLDVLVISSAFWVLDKSSLLGLLDDTAIDRMLLDPNLQASEVKARKSAGAQIQTSLTNFQNKVAEIYNIADQLWQQIQFQNVQ